MVSVHYLLHGWSFLHGEQTKKNTQRLSLPGYSCSGGFDGLGALPESPGATTRRMELVTSRHITQHTTNAEHVFTGAVGR